MPTRQPLALGLRLSHIRHRYTSRLKESYLQSLGRCPQVKCRLFGAKAGQLDAEIARAEARLRHGQVDEADFDQQRQGHRAVDLFQTLRLTRPHAEDLVFTHGDYCLPNIMIDAGQVAGFLELGSAGIGDRYRDLALAARSITYN